MERRAFVVGMAVVMVSGRAEAQHISGRISTVGSLHPSSAAQAAEIVSAFETGLSDRGQTKGKTAVIEYAFVGPMLDELTKAAASLGQRVDVLVAWGTIAAAAAKKAQVKCPVVFASVGFPVTIGLIESLREPRTNFTGITFEAADDTYAKRLQLLKELVPGISRVAALGPNDDPNVNPAVDAARGAARSLGITLREMRVGSPAELPSMFARMVAEKVQALLVIAGAFAWVHRAAIADLALAHHLPSVHGLREGVVAGGVLSLGPDLVVMAGQAAGYVDRILRGAKAATLPVEQPARYEMYVNAKTARTLGLTIPPSLLLRADQVIE